MKGLVMFVLLAFFLPACSSISSLEKQCEINNVITSCNTLGWNYHKGVNVKQDNAKAAYFYNKSCDKGDDTACNNYAYILLNGLGIQKDAKKAFEIFDRLCDRHPPSCANLGNMYYDGDGVEQSYTQAYKYHNIACDKGIKDGCVSIGVMQEFGRGVEKDPLNASFLYRELCVDGIGKGCSRLGILYFYGNGVEKSFLKAREFSKKGCDLGDELGCNTLGTIYANGLGTERNMSSSLDLFQKACNKGLDMACKNTDSLNRMNSVIGTGKVSTNQAATDNRSNFLEVFFYLLSAGLSGYAEGRYGNTIKMPPSSSNMKTDPIRCTTQIIGKQLYTDCK